MEHDSLGILDLSSKNQGKRRRKIWGEGETLKVFYSELLFPKNVPGVF